MANLKVDLLNELNNKKMYAELELVRLAGDPNMNYEVKIASMHAQLDKISLLNSDVNLVGQYFAEPQPQPAPVAAGAPVPNAPQGGVHPGQSHGE